MVRYFCIPALLLLFSFLSVVTAYATPLTFAEMLQQISSEDVRSLLQRKMFWQAVNKADELGLSSEKKNYL